MSGSSHPRLTLVVLSFAIAGATCEPVSVRVTNRPPTPLVDDAGRVDFDGFAALIAAVEEQRGLRFIQRPELEILEPDDARLPALRASERDLAPCPRSTAPVGAGKAATVAGACFPDAGLERALCFAPPDLPALRRALGRLLDAQNYPRLARTASRLRGDPGVAVRSMLAASVQRESMVGIAPPPSAPPFELLDLPTIEVAPQAAPEGLCESMALSFLAVQSDPEAPFRTPPLSTKQLVSTRAYRTGERPVELVGRALPIDGCTVASDESVGVARLLVERMAKGGALPTRELAAWRGDRGIRFDCSDGRQPWIYVAELRDDALAAPFAAKIAPILPAAFVGSPELATLEKRVAIWSGLPARQARAFATSLVAKERVRIDDPVARNGLD